MAHSLRPLGATFHCYSHRLHRRFLRSLSFRSNSKYCESTHSCRTHGRYYIFGFLFLVFVILIITCAEITIVMCYFQLCSEDYHWWWRAYLTSGSCALYLFLYSVFYFATRLELTRVTSAFLFFG